MDTQDLNQETNNFNPDFIPEPPTAEVPAQEMQQTQSCKKKEPKPDTRSRKFWRTVLGSFVGFLLANTLLIVLGLFILVAAFNSSVSIPKNSVLELTLDAPIAERSSDAFAYSIRGMKSPIGLDDILRAIDEAKNDDKIKGISLNLTAVSGSPASLEEIRRALQEFKQSGKFVYAYSDTYSQSAYYIASVADKVYLNPQGTIDLRGLSLQNYYFKGLLDMLQIDIEVVKHGRYKSAVEPYSRYDMSEASREQSEALANSIWGTFTKAIAQSRKISVDQLNEIADSLLIQRGADALQYKLVDELNYRTEYIKALHAKSGVDEKKKITLVSLDEYTASLKESSVKSSSKKVAVIYAVGEIIDGEGSESVIGSTSLSREIRRAAQDENVKAIVLRVNSPGGSALASEVIWNEIEQAKKAGKVVVTSMGDYAASGGYYISCNSDAIVAEPTTITGSIGVFGMVPSFGNFLSNYLQIYVDGVNTNAHSDALTGYRAMDEKESEFMQNSVDDTYATFLSRVAKGRKMSIEDVDSVGMGRVWTGEDALKIGLVNKLGNLQDAIKLAAQKAGIDDKYEVVYYPEKKTFMEMLTSNNVGQEEVNIEDRYRTELGELYPAFAALRQIRHLKGVQARLPMEFIIE